MSTLNGIGTKFYGFTPVDAQGCCYTTNWFTFLYFPVTPLWRAKIKRDPSRPQTFSYQLLQKTPLVPGEILRTYLYGWIIGPVAAFWPLIISVREVAEMLGVNTDGSFYNWMIGFAIVYFVIFIWKWRDWDEKRGLPANGKEFSNAKNKEQ